jgi:Fe-S cluster biogenesis protein NfuA
VASGVRRRVVGAAKRVLGREPATSPVPPPVVHAAPPPAPEPPPPAPTPAVTAAAATEEIGAPLMTREAVERLFEDMVRPALQSDGGDITLVDVKGNDVYVELVGACQSCASSVVTMEMGIERLLAEEFPGFGRLIRVDA